MVQANNSQQIDVKLSLDLAAQRKSPIVKRVLAQDFASLTAMGQKMAEKHGVDVTNCPLRYFDGESWVIVEDDDDLKLAFAIAMSDTKKLTLAIKPVDQVASVPKESTVSDNDEEMKQEPATGQKKCKKDKVKGIPRKALKNLINNELEKQAQEVFKQLLKSDDLPQAEQAAGNPDAIHEGIECDGCSVNPIRGLRFKCSVCKNYDLCSACEERLSHEHAMLKISVPGGAPDVMITMLGDENPTAEENAEVDPKDPAAFINQMMQAFGGRGGRGGRGRGHCGGRGGRGGFGPFKGMIHEFMNKMGVKPEDMNCGQNWNFNGKKDWK